MRTEGRNRVQSGFKFATNILAAMFTATCVFAQGTSFTYQGQLNDAGFAANGTYDMEFKMWNSDPGGGQVGSTITHYGVVVEDGLFAVELEFGSGIFTGANRWLEIGVQTNGGGGFTTLSPRNKFTSTPHAIMADLAFQVPNGSIGPNQVLNNSLTASDLGPNSVGTSEVIDNNLTANDLAADSVGASEIAANAVGQSEIAAGGVASSEVLDNSLTANDLASSSVGASEIATGAVGTSEVANGSLTTSDLNLTSVDARYVEVAGDTMTGDLSLYDTGNAGDIIMENQYPFIILNRNLASGNNGIAFQNAGTRVGGLMMEGADGSLHLNTGTSGFDNDLVISSSGLVGLGRDATTSKLEVKGSADLYATDGSLSVQIQATSSGIIKLNDSSGSIAAQLAAGTGGYQYIYQADGQNGVYLDGDSSGAGRIQIYDVAGSASIILDGDVGGDGRITCDELQINGGSDLSEQFDIQTDAVAGSVVCIDPVNPGKLVVSSKAYDRTVAGIVSGAGGVKPGMMMGQSGTIADGDHPVALTGRVYCMVDASEAPIVPGDLITTSSLPGHGMKVLDYGQAQGAIIGKAMTPLADGQGMVLVLVSLQ